MFTRRPEEFLLVGWARISTFTKRPEEFLLVGGLNFNNSPEESWFISQFKATNFVKYLLFKNAITLSVFMLEKSYLHQNGTEFNFLFIGITTRNLIPPRGARGEKRHHWNCLGKKPLQNIKSFWVSQYKLCIKIVSFPLLEKIMKICFESCRWNKPLPSPSRK